tara:strand:+ start:879 stop:1133 length:255 start_codon:yes stop_codon:yes gene_type:complete
MAIWIVEVDNYEGSTWLEIFGTRKEALEEATSDHYGKRYKNRSDLYDAMSKFCEEEAPYLTRTQLNERPRMYCIYKTDSYYTGA